MPSLEKGFTLPKPNLSQHINQRLNWYFISNPQTPYVVWLTKFSISSMKNKLYSSLYFTMTFGDIRLEVYF